MTQQLLLHQPVVEGAKPFPAKTFDIIYADPPWQYNDKKKNRGGAERHYQTQTDYWIQSLPVSQIAADDALLFMWATFPKLDVAIATMNAWGFDYKTAGFIWVKKNSKAGTNFMGMGSHTRANAEPCLLGVRGNGLKRVSASVRQIIESPIRKHSEKPPETRDRIVELVDRPRIELFAREKVSGWDSWGDDECLH